MGLATELFGVIIQVEFTNFDGTGAIWNRPDKLKILVACRG